ncbi:hypothetical protein AYO21_11991 [Fonsecaea monophora]|uniref:Major facilitator superfamily (MFS) profile domain-containing protein n=1 Tax=Fonsecaea monophora TaxID=254056 RepID=A0A177EPI8_9EURO|nr:hypothetical protein AYO21_11991 [Fonsecaea monophora]OAG33905.1 hypothetical protein AYO21_11991 [Fonsecaea monophora]
MLANFWDHRRKPACTTFARASVEALSFWLTPLVFEATARISSPELGWMGLGFYYIKGNAAWRTLLGLQLATATFMPIASFWMPFSPRWPIMKGRRDEALEEFHQIKTRYRIYKANKLGLVAIFKKKSYRKRMYLILFMSFCQFTGIIPLQKYQVTIYTKLGFTNVFSLILTGILGTLGCLSVDDYRQSNCRQARSIDATNFPVFCTGRVI